MANGLTLKELASSECRRAWNRYVRFRHIASSRHNLPKKCRIKLEPQVTSEAKRAYKDLKIDPVTCLPTVRPALIKLTSPMSVVERREYLEKSTYEDAERDEV